MRWGSSALLAQYRCACFSHSLFSLPSQQLHAQFVIEACLPSLASPLYFLTPSMPHHHPILYARGAAEGPDIRAFAASAAAEARELAQEWTEQRSIFHSRLYDQCIRPPLQVGFQGFIEVHMLWGMARLAEGHTGGSNQLQPACCGVSLQRPRSRSGWICVNTRSSWICSLYRSASLPTLQQRRVCISAVAAIHKKRTHLSLSLTQRDLIARLSDPSSPDLCSLAHLPSPSRDTRHKRQLAWTGNH